MNSFKVDHGVNCTYNIMDGGFLHHGQERQEPGVSLQQTALLFERASQVSPTPVFERGSQERQEPGGHGRQQAPKHDLNTIVSWELRTVSFRLTFCLQ